MKIDISDEALANDNKGCILDFIRFAEKVYTECPAILSENENGDKWIVRQDTNGVLSHIEFPKAKYSQQEAIATFKLFVYGKSESDTKNEETVEQD